MKHCFMPAALAALVLSLGVGPSFGAGKSGSEEEAASRQAGPVTQADEARQKENAEQRKAAAKIKLVDINSASLAELKKLPGIGDAEARRIIAGRPYGSTAWLTTKQIVPEGVYLSIRDSIIARQPFKDGDKNAEIYRKLNEKEAADQKAANQKATDKK